MTEALSSTPERLASSAVRDTESSPNDRDVLELDEIQTHEDSDLDLSTPSVSSGDEYRVTINRTTSRRPLREHKGPWGKLCRFWTHRVTLTVARKSNRDHFGWYPSIMAIMVQFFDFDLRYSVIS